MARLGFGPNWECTFANDINPRKTATYARNFGESHLLQGDISGVCVTQLPGHPDAIWMSPPCQDVSEAGSRVGLAGARSGAFWPGWNLVTDLISDGRAPRVIVLESVTGLLEAHDGRDIAAVRQAFEDAGYWHSTIVINAAHFVPQSRERVFVVGARDAYPAPLVEAAANRLPIRNIHLADLLEDDPPVKRFSPAEVERHLAMMAPEQRAKVESLRATGRKIAGPFARRMRGPKSGERIQRVEVRLDGLANALRVPGGDKSSGHAGGGSSKQFVMIIRGASTEMRALSPREAARLMGIPEDYVLPANENEALSLCGDGVVVPVVRHIAEHIVEPILARVTDTPTATERAKPRQPAEISTSS
jgi:DNA (cytosine-5)-methyltransferase 1